MKFFVIFLLFPFTLLSQTVTSDFQLPANVCLDENFRIQNASNNATTYSWDFSQGDLSAIPSPVSLKPVGGNIIQDVEVVFDGERWIGFAISNGSNSILRLDFDNDLLSSPVITDLGNVGTLLNQPTGIKVIKEGAEWYGFVLNRNQNGASGLIIRIDFGNSLLNNSLTSHIIMSGTGGSDGGLDIVRHNSNWFIFYCGRTTHPQPYVGVLKLSSATGIPTASDQVQYVIPGANYTADCKLIRHQGNWFGYVIANQTPNLLRRLSFGNDLFNAPQIDDITNSDIFTNSPYGVEVGYDEGNYNLFISTLEGKVIRVNLGDDLTQSPISYHDLGNLGVLVNTLKFSLVKHQSRWVAFFCNYSSTTLYNAVFPETVKGASTTFSVSEEPSISYTIQGTKSISLVACNDDFECERITKTLSLNPLEAPEIAFEAQNICVDSDVSFLASGDSPSIATYQWSFGDSQSSTDPNPSHRYPAAGNFEVSLAVVGNNGCNNLAQQSIELYSAPVAGFIIPPGIICTNDETVFTNTTTDTFEGNLEYKWYVDDNFVSDNRNLAHTFTTLNSHAIKLITSIPGCAAESTQNTSLVLAGPTIEFSFIGACQDESILFDSEINGAVNSQTWDFADGNLSTEQNPSHVFLSEGVYDVTLTALSSNGCQNKKTNTIIINDRPTPDFAIDPAPSSCSGSLSRLYDLTPAIVSGTIANWSWRFGDGSIASEQNPSHTFADAGEHEVALTVTTDAGCSNEISKSITILQSPSVEFSNTPACLSQPANFSGISDNAVQYYWEIGTSFYEVKHINHTFNSSGSHPVLLTVVGSNDCVSTIEKIVVVPEPFSPSIAVVNHCKGNAANFSLVNSGSEMVVSTLWNFANEATSAETNPSYIFASTGNKEISLQVTTSEGCTYKQQMVVAVIEPPKAKFSISPAFGIPLQEILFSNESENATAYAWNFDDGAISSLQSPTHVFDTLGDYDVVLSVSNTAGCKSVFEKRISMVAPLPDVNLNLMTLSTNPDGTLRVIITIENKGNTFLRNLPVQLDVSGQVKIETIITDAIAPFSMYNLVLNYSIARTRDLYFLCASAELDGDLDPVGNRVCNTLQLETAVIKPYPNPTIDFLNVEWIGVEDDETLYFSLIDPRGQTVLSTSEISSIGLNRRRLDLQRVTAGVYILKISSTTTSQTHKILVSN